jgi:hypothetical protein
MFSEAQNSVNDRQHIAGSPRRFKLVRIVNGVVEHCDFVGAFDSWDSSWSMQMRIVPVRKQVAA